MWLAYITYQVHSPLGVGEATFFFGPDRRGKVDVRILRGFNITVGNPAQLVYSVQPSTEVSTQSISPAIEVQVLDAGGNLVPTATDSITLAINNNPGGGTLSGTLVVAAISGEATSKDQSVLSGWGVN